MPSSTRDVPLAEEAPVLEDAGMRVARLLSALAVAAVGVVLVVAGAMSMGEGIPVVAIGLIFVVVGATNAVRWRGIATHSRDLTWDAIVTASEHMRERYAEATMTVRPQRRRDVPRWCCCEGFEAADKWTVVFEPVRKRHLLSRHWRPVQPVENAAAKIGDVLRSSVE